MKAFSLTVSLLLFFIAQACSQARPDVYLASTPCSQGTRPLPGMDTQTDCEYIKWKLALYKDRFELHCDYGTTQQNTKGFRHGKSVDLSGSWTIVKGAPGHPNATVYQLHDRQSNQKISFMKLGDNLLHLLDADLQLMTGNGAWSYTLSKIQ